VDKSTGYPQQETMNMKQSRPQEPDERPPLLLSIPEVARSLRLSRAKVYRLIYYEGLPVLHFGRAARVSVIALQEWIERREKGA
jgi:excisionase family DNA binding protein